MNTNYSCTSIHFAGRYGYHIYLLCSVRTDADGLAVKHLRVLKGIAHPKLEIHPQAIEDVGEFVS